MSIKSETLSKRTVNSLKNGIIAKLDPNDKLPSERKLVQIYKVSRTTVRSALNELETLGYIYRQRGKGTFVSYRPTHATNLAETFSFSKSLEESGVSTSTKILFFKEIVAKEYQAKMLRVDIGTPIYELKRIRYANKNPMIVERTYLNKEIFEGLTLEELKNQGLYNTFKNNFGIKIFAADETCTAAITSADNNKILNISSGTPVLKLERLTSDIDNRIVEFTLSIARSDKFTYHIRQYYQENKQKR